MNYYKTFIKTIRWLAAETVIYEGIFTVHQLALAHILPLAEIGLIGATFGISYLGACIFNVGLEPSLAPLFGLMTRSRHHCYRYFVNQLLFQTVLYAFFILLSWLILLQYNHFTYFLSPKSVSLFSTDSITFLIISFFIIIEGTRKALRSFLQLAGFVQHIALLEIMTIIGYVGIIWLSYFIGLPITYRTCLFTLLCILIITLAIMLGLFFRYYNTSLPESDLNGHQFSSEPQAWKKIMKNRCANSFSQISNQLLSANILIPTFAGILGNEQAGLLTIIWPFYYFFITIFKRSFGISSSISLAHLKNESSEVKQFIFRKISNSYFLLLTLVSACLFILHKPILLWLGHPHAEWLILLLLTIRASEYLFITFERLFLIEEHTHLFLLITMTNIFAIWLFIGLFVHQLPLLITLIIILRTLTFILLSKISQHRLGIKLW